jgi:hypothetical protein
VDQVSESLASNVPSKDNRTVIATRFSLQVSWATRWLPIALANILALGRGVKRVGDY